MAQMVNNPPGVRETWVGKIPGRRERLPTPVFLSFTGGSDGKESTCNAGDLGSIPGLGRSTEEGKGYHKSHFLRMWVCFGFVAKFICVLDSRYK